MEVPIEDFNAEALVEASVDTPAEALSGKTLSKPSKMVKGPPTLGRKSAADTKKVQVPLRYQLTKRWNKYS